MVRSATGKSRPFGGTITCRRSPGRGRFLHPVEEMNPTGEIHLGPGQGIHHPLPRRNVVVDGLEYVRNAVHVPGIIAHKTGHHVTAIRLTSREP